MVALQWANVYDGIWSMQAREFNNDETVFIFALYLHCISLVITLLVQLQLKRGYEILLVYL